MRIKPGFELRDVCGEKIVQAVGLQNIDYTRITDLNETAAFLFERMTGRDFTVQDMADALCSKYDVSTDTALADSRALAGQWLDAGFLEDGDVM